MPHDTTAENCNTRSNTAETAEISSHWKSAEIADFPSRWKFGPYEQKNGGGIVLIPPPRSLRRAYAVSCRETKNPNPLPTANRFGFFDFGGLEGDRTLDLCDANKPLKLFPIISGRFWPFPLRSTSSLGLFDHAVSVWSGAECGRFCGQKRSPALAGVFADRDGERFSCL